MKGSSNYHSETMKEVNYGLDISLFSYKMNFTIDLYNKKIENVSTHIPNLLNFSEINEYFNEAVIVNKGLEFGLNTFLISGDVSWKSSITYSYNNNKVISAEYHPPVNEINIPIGNFIGYNFAGYNEDDNMLITDSINNITPDLNRNNRKSLGNGVPKSFLAFTNTLAYKNFDLSISIRGAFGFEVLNRHKIYRETGINYKNNTQTIDTRDLKNTFLYQTDYFIEKGDYIKINNLTIGYTIPIKNKTLNSIRVYATCNNLALFTKLSNGDPEMAGINSLHPGYLYGESYYLTRTFLMGIKFII